MNYTMLSKDTRPISELVLSRVYHRIGEQGVTRISAFDENGEMAHVPWFEVWKGERLYARVNAAYVEEVHYEEGTASDDDTPF